MVLVTTRGKESLFLCKTILKVWHPLDRMKGAVRIGSDVVGDMDKGQP